MALLTDVELVRESLDPTLFPGISSSIGVHEGFSSEQAKTATAVLAAVQAAMAATGSTDVLITGHSLGSAIALLDAVYLPLHLPANTQFTSYLFGLPRIGNQEFADYVDAHVTNLAHITNLNDPCPIIPGISLGYHQPSGEKHIVTTGLADGDWYACDGQDNTSKDCSTGAVPNILESDYSKHYGPYGTVTIECGATP